MTKKNLRDKIQGVVRQVYKSTSLVNLDSSEDIDVSLETEKFPMLLKFPELKRVLVDFLTNQYEIFIKDIQWVAPKPTTFRIVLANGEVFYLIYAVRSWIAKIEGKKYYLLNLNEEESAIEAIARMLSFGNSSVEDPADPADTSVDTGGGDFPGGEDGGEEVDVTVDDEVEVEA